MPSFDETAHDQRDKTNELLQAILDALGKDGNIMATLQDVIDAQQATDDSVEQAAARVAVDLQALVDQVAALQAQIDAGTNVTADDLQALVDKLGEIKGEADAIDVTP